jgi:hypothetical protein
MQLSLGWPGVGDRWIAAASGAVPGLSLNEQTPISQRTSTIYRLFSAACVLLYEGHGVGLFEMRRSLVCLIRKDATVHKHINTYYSTRFALFRRRSRRQGAQILGPEGLALAPTTRLPAHSATAH